MGNMNDKNFIDLLKNIQSVMRCPSCGSVYEVSEMQFVSSQEGYFLLSLNCAKCSLPVWVNVFAGSSRDKIAPVGDLTVNDLHLMEREPISINEVVEFSSYISKFKGDFKNSFR